MYSAHSTDKTNSLTTTIAAVITAATSHNDAYVYNGCAKHFISRAKTNLLLAIYHWLLNIF